MPRPERPLAAGTGPVVDFATGLRRLRDGAGRPGYRELARRTHFSVTTLSEAAAGRRLPTLPVTLAYVKACGGDQAEWEARWRQVASETGTAAPEPASGYQAGNGGRCPYLGLAAYQPEDFEWFFGRRELVADLLSRLADKRFLGVFGPSGVGKSSLLRAGLLPAVRDGALTDGQPAVVLMTPGADPLDELAVRLARLAGTTAGGMRDELRADASRAGLAVRQAVADRPPACGLLLVVDQFEEVFTQCHDAGQRRAFVAALLAAAQAQGGTRVVLGVRADYYGACAGFPELVSALRDSQVLVGPMSVTELREAVTGPAERASLMVEGSLVSTVVADTAGRPGALPLASHALLEAWRRRRGNAVTLAGYVAAGGVSGAIARTAEELYRRLTDEEQEAAREILLRLVEIGADGEGMRRRVNRAELDTGGRAVTRVLDQLAAARLVTLGRDTVEVAHETLIAGWPRLRGWVDDDRDGVRLRRRIAEAAADWTSLDRDRGLLLRGARLSAAARWTTSQWAQLSTQERAFVDASLAAQRHDRAVRRRRVRFALTGLVAALATVSVLATLAVAQAGRAQVERDLARSRQVLAEARVQLALDPELALLLAQHAYRLRPAADTEAVLRQATDESRVIGVIAGPERGPVFDLEFGADGRRLAGVNGRAVHVWDWATGRETMSAEGWDQVAFSPDGQRLVTGSSAEVGDVHGVSIWDTDGRATQRAFELPGAPAIEVALSPDGQRVIVASGDGAVWSAEVTRNELRRLLAGGAREIVSAALSPDGTRIATGELDGTVRIRGVDGADQVIRQTPGVVSALAFSADGSRVAAAGGDGTVQIWEASGTGDRTILHGHEADVTAVAFSPDGGRVVTASVDRTVRIWDSSTGAHPLVLRGHRSPVLSVAFSRDGRHVASGDEGGTVRIWDAAGRADPVLHRGPADHAAVTTFSSNGRYLATAEADGRVLVTATRAAGVPVASYPGHDDSWGLAVSADGRIVASASFENEIRLSSPALGTVPRTLRCRGRIAADMQVLDLAMSPDGRLVAAHCGPYNDGYRIERGVQVWKVPSGAPSIVLAVQEPPLAFDPSGTRLATVDHWKGPRVRVSEIHGAPEFLPPGGRPAPTDHLAFSHDGNRLAAAGADGAIRVWDVHANREPIVLSGHPGSTRHVAFSPDGRLIASTGSDGAIRIWSPVAGVEPVVLAPYSDPYASVAFTPDLQHLATVHTDGSVRVWRCEVCAPIEQVRSLAERRTTRELSAEERATYLGE